MAKREPAPEMPSDFRFEMSFVRLATMKHGDDSFAEEAKVRIFTFSDEYQLPGDSSNEDLAGEVTAVFLDARHGLGDYYGSFIENFEDPPYLAEFGFDAMEDGETHLLLINDAVVDERFRGYRLSLVMAAGLIEHLSNGRNIRVLIHPLPHRDYAREAAYDEADETTQSAMDAQDIKDFSKLTRHWKKMGFGPKRMGGILTMAASDYDPEDLYQELMWDEGRRTRTKMRSARARARDAELRRLYENYEDE